jgi:hypothetical protein
MLLKSSSRTFVPMSIVLTTFSFFETWACKLYRFHAHFFLANYDTSVKSTLPP